uniref:Uncharacterized protein n=1 Tax=Meloidogyne javanica TaxID=6303 RepID=A0A915M9T7_MELJA
EEPIIEIDSPVDSVVHLFSNSNETMFVVEQKGIQTIPLDVAMLEISVRMNRRLIPSYQRSSIWTKALAVAFLKIPIGEEVVLE